MTIRLVNCAFLKKQATGLTHPPYPGDLGKRLYHEISAEAWQQWLAHQTRLINEYRLNMLDDSARQFLKEEMIKFLFEGGAEAPPGYTPEK